MAMLDAAPGDEWEDIPSPPPAAIRPVASDEWENITPDRGALSVAGREAGQSAEKGLGETMKGESVLSSMTPAWAQPILGAVFGREAPELSEPGKPASESPFYKTGEAVTRQAEQTFPVTEEERKAHPIASTVGSIAGGVGPILAISAADPAAGLALGAAHFGLGGIGETYDAAKAKGADEATAREAAALNGALNAALGVIPVGNVLKPFLSWAPEAAPWAIRKLAQMGRTASPLLLSARRRPL